ncbi:RDD family protein [Rheinheimera sp.]|uniref:RDD family protein n=1 Tax=Rheinheimera sp. TaxID=1869214 RepID=UPI002733EB99|nr:RDD family protein [Rheinheimera sp.]MDP2715227.1 RDD family protein [Rheinheimera sp.]
MDISPDYKNYTLEDLYSAARSINQEMFPERTAQIHQLIAEKEAELAANSSAQNDADNTLATRTHRFWGAIIDMVLQIICTIPFFWFVGWERLQQLTPWLMLAGLVYGVAVYLLLHGYLLHKYGQTIGKAEFGMRIETLDGKQATLSHVMLWRYLPTILFSYVPAIGQFLAGLVNPLFIFGKEKRCLHDYIAKTRVSYISNAESMTE